MLIISHFGVEFVQGEVRSVFTHFFYFVDENLEKEKAKKG